MERLLHPEDKDLARKVARSTFVTRLFVLVCVAVCGVVLYVSLAIAADTNEVVTSVQDQQEANTGVVKGIEGLAEKIDSCTDPKGACTKRGQKSTAEAIGDINRITAIAAACADQAGQQSLEQIQACIIAELAHQRP